MVIRQTAHGSDGVSTRRPLLLTLIALGSLVCLIGSTGLFAALTDTAETGTNDVDSASVLAAADIQLADAALTINEFGGSQVTCLFFSDNLITPFFTADGLEPGDVLATKYFCIQNAGSQPVAISASVSELADLDTDCTNDEPEYDTTCGGDQEGELSSVVRVAYAMVDCSTASSLGGWESTLKESEIPQIFSLGDPGTLAPGAHACFSVDLSYDAGTPADFQRAQSDRATWRFLFTAEAI